MFDSLLNRIQRKLWWILAFHRELFCICLLFQATTIATGSFSLGRLARKEKALDVNIGQRCWYINWGDWSGQPRVWPCRLDRDQLDSRMSLLLRGGSIWIWDITRLDKSSELVMFLQVHDDSGEVKWDNVSLMNIPTLIKKASSLGDLEWPFFIKKKSAKIF